MTKLTRVDEEADSSERGVAPASGGADRDNPFRPGSLLEREADSILRGSLISRNSIQLGGAAASPTKEDAAADFTAAVETLVDVLGDHSKELVAEHQRRGSKGHVRIKEDTVFIMSPDTQVTTALIADDDQEDPNEDDDDDEDDDDEMEEDVVDDEPAADEEPHSRLDVADDAAEASVVFVDVVKAERTPQQQSQPPGGNGSLPHADDTAMVEVQVRSATLHAASPSIAEAVSVEEVVNGPRASVIPKSAAAKKQRHLRRNDEVAQKKLCCVLM